MKRQYSEISYSPLKGFGLKEREGWVWFCGVEISAQILKSKPEETAKRIETGAAVGVRVDVADLLPRAN